MAVVINGTTGVSGVDGSAGTPSYQGTDSNTGIFFPAADTIAFGEGGAEAMRIDSSGNVGIGTSSPSYKLTVTSSSNAANNVLTGSGIVVGTTIGLRERGNSNGISGTAYASQIYQGASGGGHLEIYNVASTYGLVFGTETTERARITSGGALLVGTTSTGIYNQTSGGGFATLGNGETYISRQSDVPLWVNRNTSTGNLVLFYYGSTNVGNISTNGSTITFSGNALSDERHKENVEPINNALNAINAVNFVTFNYKANGQVSAGVIAQQVETIEAIKPFVINGVSEEDYKAFDYNALVGYMGKAIQELKAITDAQATRIEALEAEVAALKGAN